ncbi:MAG: glycine cleavage system aminomethyltransferase GcvT [Alphaproteobacteria bacterium]
MREKPSGPVPPPPKESPLSALHAELGAKMVPFAGYNMPLQYGAGIVAEHLHTRAGAALFDVSHMGQIALRGEGAAGALETLVPGDIRDLAPGALRYTLLTDDKGGILDDLMVTNEDGHLFLVVNAARKQDDLAHLARALGGRCDVEPMFSRALLALQGPAAAAALARHAPECLGLGFMNGRSMPVAGFPCLVSRSGYSGEDGFEISVAADDAQALARRLLAEPEVAPAGLGARDSLRLEAGLCLYGHDIDETTTPIEAGLAWSIGKRRRAEGGFPGAETILAQLRDGPARRRVGIRPEGRVIAREGSEIVDPDGRPLGQVTSGTFGPTVKGPIAMGYMRTEGAAPAEGTEIRVMVRGRERPAQIAALPFVAHRYHRS